MDFIIISSIQNTFLIFLLVVFMVMISDLFLKRDLDKNEMKIDSLELIHPPSSAVLSQKCLKDLQGFFLKNEQITCILSKNNICLIYSF